MKRSLENIAWYYLNWQRPYKPELVAEVLTHLAATLPRGPVVVEVRGCQGKVSYLLGCDQQYVKQIHAVFKAHGNIQFRKADEADRQAVTTAKQLKVTHPSLSLQTEHTLAVTRAGLSALLQAHGQDEVVLQLILGPSFAPTSLAKQLPDPKATWVQAILGNVGPASAESRSSMREKVEGYRFSAVIRLGSSGDEAAAKGNLFNLYSALRTLESAGVSIQAVNEKPENLDNCQMPWHFPLTLSVRELTNFMLQPVGDEELPGVTGLHPKQLLPPKSYRNPDRGHDRTFATGVGVADQARLSISPKDSLEHTIILGPTGSGKSTAMLNLILSDINAGRSVLVLDPKTDLVNDILARIPESRDNDVVVLDPSDYSPVGFNPLALSDHYNPNLIADAIIAVFHEIFSENWGILTQDILTAALLTLVKCEGASLLWLPTLLTDETFRKKVTAGVTDQIGLQPFWDNFNNKLKDSERLQQIGPVLNKLRQFLLRPSLRNVLGQSQPQFNLMDLFKKPRIVLVPLNNGLIGAESARLLGSLIVGLTWTMALSRARVPAERRRLVSIYIDELQDYLSLPTSLSDALAQARGLGVGICMAHQYRAQLPPDIRAGVDANARNKIVFGLNSADAKDMAAMAPELEAVDFMSLPRYQVYTSFQQGGKNTGWVSGQTLPPPQAFRSPVELRAKSMARYGKPAEQVEQEYLDLVASYHQPDAEEDADEDNTLIGRRKRS